MPTESLARILRLKAVLERTGLSRSTLYQRCRRARSRGRCGFPHGARVGGNPTSTRGYETPKPIRCCDCRAIRSHSGSTEARNTSR